jgi:hypothetical protein
MPRSLTRLGKKTEGERERERESYDCNYKLKRKLKDLRI